jgi:hypothetical protein
MFQVMVCNCVAHRLPVASNSTAPRPPKPLETASIGEAPSHHERPRDGDRTPPRTLSRCHAAPPQATASLAILHTAAPALAQHGWHTAHAPNDAARQLQGSLLGHMEKVPETGAAPAQRASLKLRLVQTPTSVPELPPGRSRRSGSRRRPCGLFVGGGLCGCCRVSLLPTD